MIFIIYLMSLLNESDSCV